jgi:hypothetical protein
MKILVAEFPKSGGSWVVSMIGDALEIPKRDLYIDDGYSIFDASLHPWYRGYSSLSIPENCVIKSHELPDSKLHSFSAARIHLIRDCRDVIVSRYFFRKDFCVKNGITGQFSDSFEELAEYTSREWAHFVSAWAKEDAVVIHYESFLIDTVRELRRVFDALGIPVSDAMLRYAVQNNTKDKFRESLSAAFKHNTFVRKGIAGDWTNYFSDRVKEIVKGHAGASLSALGYTKNDAW